MLIQFNFKNYKSFKDDVSLDLSSTKITEHENHVFEAGNEKLLKIAAIYGANASGKSNIYNAFDFMTYYVSESFKFGGEDHSKQKPEDIYTKVVPFLFDENSVKEPSTFEVFFMDNNDSSGRIYQYGFALNKDEVLEEWLYTKAKSSKEYKTIIYRKKGQLINYSGIKKGAENIDISLEKETLIISLGAKLKISKLKMVRDWFIENYTINFGDPFENLVLSRVLPMNFAEDKNVQLNVAKYISTFDNTIKDFKIEIEFELGNKRKEEEVIKVESLHKMIAKNEYKGIPLEDESSGTLKMFSLYSPIQQVLENGSTLFVDELNARLHPLLLRNIILTFINPNINKKNAQLIFTTHDAWQLTNELLRRDEIWFVEKDNDGVSSLYSLADFVDDDGVKIRKDEMYAKNYLLGKYGAIPSLKSLDMLDGD